MIETSNLKLYNDDCFNVFPSIPDKSIDAIICDLPYGTTACKWDTILPFDQLWTEYKRIIKDNGAIVLFGSQPFTSALVMSNPKMFKYEWIWTKNRHSNFFNNTMPRKFHENILVFYKNQPTYNPIYEELSEQTKGRFKRSYGQSMNNRKEGGQYKEAGVIDVTGKDKALPKSIQHFNLEQNNQFATKVYHPTQKPVALLEYLVKTYTNEGDTVLDNTMGSGTTGVACMALNRQFIGIEKEKEYFDIAVNRITNTQIKLAI